MGRQHRGGQNRGAPDRGGLPRPARRRRLPVPSGRGRGPGHPDHVAGVPPLEDLQGHRQLRRLQSRLLDVGRKPGVHVRAHVLPAPPLPVHARRAGEHLQGPSGGALGGEQPSPVPDERDAPSGLGHGAEGLRGGAEVRERGQLVQRGHSDDAREPAVAGRLRAVDAQPGGHRHHDARPQPHDVLRRGHERPPRLRPCGLAVGSPSTPR